MKDFHQKVISFQNELKSEDQEHGFHRYKSWEHCYHAFGQSNIDIDHLALHLSIYLASWGMYRGSSFILEFDYKLNVEIVNIIKKHKDLYDISFEEFGEKIPIIVKLHKEVKAYYEETLKVYSKNDKVLKVKASETLTTKILMGSLGCVPAYDRYYKAGLKNCGIKQSFSLKGLQELFEYVSQAKINFKKTSKVLEKNSGGLKYPEMKMVDMYFFQSARKPYLSEIKIAA
ncbi:MAG: hypothetical protein CME62_05995 [Halobacteriovoraceae bacterium]|nr:hypothetical protein [Halobacteriovoraceae bacterium]|tara:strand:- start:18436 stop:19125 length:690 start_codon:yes stop_codon:yes gene_type:complete